MSKINTRMSRAQTNFSIERGEKPRGEKSDSCRAARREWVKAVRAEGRVQCKEWDEE